MYKRLNSLSPRSRFDSRDVFKYIFYVARMAKNKKKKGPSVCDYTDDCDDVRNRCAREEYGFSFRTDWVRRAKGKRPFVVCVCGRSTLRCSDENNDDNTS